VESISPPKGAITDGNGTFRIDRLPVGRYDVRATFVGYEPTVFREVMVTSGKEAVLEIAMTEQLQRLGEVVVRPTTNKEAPLNPMALVGGRMFSVEEANRFAGGFDDPARLVTAFAGVAGGMNSNGIAIRGNSPQFLQWRLEGVEIPNPTHFSDITGAGGGIITALSSQVLGNSDFYTGAFPAEYGNALSGVFDMQLRSGNNQQYEYTAQIGTLGVEFASEGPFKKGGRASYLFNYRYSSMALAADLLPDVVGEAGGMRYQDLSFKLNFPTVKAGTLSVWGIGITNHYLATPPEDTLEWTNTFEGMGDSRQTKAAGGLTHKLFLDGEAYLKTSLAVSYSKNRLLMEQWDTKMNKSAVNEMNGTNTDLIFTAFLNRKFGATHVNRTGVTVTGLFYDIDYNSSPDVNQWPPLPMVNFARSNGQSALLAAYSQSNMRLNGRLSASAGLHAQYFCLNGRYSIEPRVSLKWQHDEKQAWGIAYGLHSRHEKLDYYFVTTPQSGATPVNKNLKLAKAHHLVLSYDLSVSANVHLKVEAFNQYLFDVPVANDSIFSIINHRAWYLMDALESSGSGLNRGIDLTLERYLNRGYYYMLTATVFRSRYRGGDGCWRNTRLDRGFLLNALGGKEWKTGRQKQNIFSLNLRCSFQGGDRYIPVNEAASQASKSVVYDTSKAYEPQFSPAFISHLTASYKINRQKLTHEIALKMYNVNGYQEPQDYIYDYRLDKPVMYKSAVSIPNLSYKIEF
jgi:hypothetical protein